MFLFHSDYTNILKLTKQVNRVFPCFPILVHSSVIKLALAGGQNKWDEVVTSMGGPELIKKNALEMLLADEKPLNNMLEHQKWIRRELFSLNPRSVAGTLINRADVFGFYPIVAAAQNRDIKLLKFLYDCGGNLYLRNDDGTGVIQEGASFYTKVLKMLIEKELKETWSSEIIVNPGYTPMQTEVAKYSSTDRRSYREDQIRKIVQFVKNDNEQLTFKNKTGKNAMIIAAQKGHLELVKALYILGVNIDETDSEGRTSLYWASSNGHYATVQYLLSLGADSGKSNKERMTALMIASEKGHSETARILIKYAVNAEQSDNEGKTAFMIACQEGHEEISQILIENGADINKSDKEGRTALMIACQEGHEETAKMLIQHSADLEQSDIYGMTALMIACQEGYEETIKILIVYRANMEKRCKYNNKSLTALMIASQHGRDIIVQILIDAGAQTTFINEFPPPLLSLQEGSKDLEKLVNIDTEEEQTKQFGWTPLMIACKYGRSEIVRILISHMESNDIISNIEQTDKKGWNSLMFACSNGDLGKTHTFLLLLMDQPLCWKGGGGGCKFLNKGSKIYD